MESEHKLVEYEEQYLRGTCLDNDLPRRLRTRDTPESGTRAGWQSTGKIFISSVQAEELEIIDENNVNMT